jgi:hypothetical protein
MWSLFFIVSLYVADFKKDFDVQETAPILFSFETGDYHGFCDHATGAVFVNYWHFQSLKPINKKELIYHELGHCTLGLRHVFGRLSIMRPVEYSATEDNWRYLLEEMKILRAIHEKH